MPSRTRKTLQISFVVLILLYPLLEWGLSSDFTLLQNQLSQDDPTTQYLRNLSCVAEDLPKHGRIGYLYGTEIGCKNDDCLKKYFLTQFALAPRIIDQNLSDLEWVIVQFENSTDPEDISSKYDLQMVKQCPEDIYLYRKQTKQP